MKSKISVCLCILLCICNGCLKDDETDNVFGEMKSAEILSFGAFQLAGFPQGYQMMEQSDENQIVYHIYDEENKKTDTLIYTASNNMLSHEHITDIPYTSVVSYASVYLNENYEITQCELERITLSNDKIHWISDQDPIISAYSKEGSFPSSTCVLKVYGLLGTNDAKLTLNHNSQWNSVIAGITYDFEDTFVYEILK